MLHATLDGRAQCRVCGRFARLDLLSRWMISIVLAVLLPMVLLYGGFFYSGHLFIVSMIVILGAWRLLSWLGLPFLSLEAAGNHAAASRKSDVWTLAVLFIPALVLDGYMASRIDADSAKPQNTSEVASSFKRDAQ